jgi:hypothetical protein
MHALGRLFNDRGRHRAAESDFDHAVVGAEVIVSLDNRPTPLPGRPALRAVGQHRQTSVAKQRRDHDPDLVRAAARIDADGHLLDELFRHIVVNEPFVLKQRVHGLEEQRAVEFSRSGRLRPCSRSSEPRTS